MLFTAVFPEKILTDISTLLMDKSEDQILRFYQNELEDLLCEFINV
jgi:hypothetical protein